MTTHPTVLARIAELSTDPTACDLLVEAGLKRFVALADRALRRVVLGEFLASLDDGSLISVLARVESRAINGDRACRWLDTELAVTPSALQDLPYLRRGELYQAASAAAVDTVARRFLLGSRPPNAKDPEDNPHLELSAGLRTAKARAYDRLTLDRLLHDRDPRVIAALLNNPRLVERDVVRIAAMRPTAPEVLACVANHPRWSSNYRVRKALAFNPCTAAPVARRLLATLLRQDLVELVDSGLLNPEMRAEVRERLARTV